MVAPIALTTVQKARRFLDTVGFAPPVYASSDEVLRRLVDHVRINRHDPTVRRQLVDLRATLARTESTGSLPAASCETVDTDALAHELANVLASGGGTSRAGSLAGPATLAAVAALLLWSGSTIGCDELPPGDDRCTDVTQANFSELIDQTTELASCEYDEYADEFGALENSERQPVISDLCEMSPDEIATYLVNQFGDSECDEDPWDDDDAYKGVTF